MTDPEIFWVCAQCKSPHLTAHYDLGCRACGKIRPGCEAMVRLEARAFMFAVVVTLIGGLIYYVRH